jgi:arsenate reductase|tara:strand:- start:282 stop:896 length:615 start_codon:yes stop_codon:yes gene_type:complete
MVLKKITETIQGIAVNSIPEERKARLQSLIEYIQDKVTMGELINLNFICTHNSRRSHLAQIWAQTMACYFNIDQLFCFSGGTEATALYPSIKDTLERQGFEFEISSAGKNPHYHLLFSDDAPAIVAFSKKYDAPFNPSSNFAAIITCSHADENCPMIVGAEKRILMSYEDPKKYDNSSQEIEGYAACSIQIACEMYHVFSAINK